MWRCPVPEPLHPYRGPGVPRPADAGDDYYVTSPYGPRDGGVHEALDIGNGRLGGPVFATAAGRVIAAGALGWPWSEPTTRYASGNYGGLMVVLEHAGGWLSLYAHLAAIAVRPAATVAAGQQLGTIGDTGSAIGQGHLHFSIGRGGAAGASSWLDPWPLLQGGDDMRMPQGWQPLHNRRTTIAARADRKVNVRSEVGDEAITALPAGTIAATYDRSTVFYPRGVLDRASGRWYGGELWIAGGWQLVFVLGSLCTALEPIESGISADELEAAISGELAAAAGRASAAVLAR